MFHTQQRFWAAFMATIFAPAFGGVVTFTDSTFSLGNYTQTPAFQSTGTISVSQCGSCGNPGQALQFVGDFPDTSVNTGLVALGIVNTTFAYNPATQGAIYSIAASVDKNFSTPPNLGSVTNAFRPMIVQDGNYYLAGIVGPDFSGGTTGFLTLSGALQASDFVQYSFSTGAFGTAHPNFAGHPILLGLAQISGVSGLSNNVRFTQAYDNLSFSVQTPEPSSFVAILALTPLMAIARRRRRAARNRPRPDISLLA